MNIHFTPGFSGFEDGIRSALMTVLSTPKQKLPARDGFRPPWPAAPAPAPITIRRKAAWAVDVDAQLINLKKYHINALDAAWSGTDDESDWITLYEDLHNLLARGEKYEPYRAYIDEKMTEQAKQNHCCFPHKTKHDLMSTE